MSLISVILCVKNGLPHLRTAIDALRGQTDRNFEIVVQDGGSTDGSVEFLRSVRDLELEIASEPDSGIGQAYNRGISRARGDFLCLASCDEYLDRDALQRGREWFLRFPGAAAVSGAVRLANADGRIFQVFYPPIFELTGIVKNDIVMPAGATFFNRARIGEDMYYDESLKTCPDYDFWLRLGSRFGPEEILGVAEPIVVARADRASQTFRVESFDQFCRDKLWILQRFLNSRPDIPAAAELRKTASAGILTWAAESVFEIEGASSTFIRWSREAAAYDPRSARLERLAKRTQAFEIDSSSGRFEVVPNRQPDVPSCPTSQVTGLLTLDSVQTFPYWEGAEVQYDQTARVATGSHPWSYAAQIPLSGTLLEDHWYWARLDLRVLSGQIGVALFADDDLRNERLILPSEDRTTAWIKINHPSARAVMIRNGSFAGPSVVEVFATTVESCPKAHMP